MFATSALLAGAAASIGGFGGFLFGIPRTLAPRSKQERENPSDTTAALARPTGPEIPSQSVNTNLEDISDWLTKIIVGVGLVEFQSILNHLKVIAERFQSSLGGSEVAVLGVIINFSSWGFFAGYLVTRLFLTSAFGDILTSEALRQAVIRTTRLEEDNTKLASQNKVLEQAAEAMNLAATGDYQEADSLFKRALQESEGSAPQGFKQILLEGSIFNSLYKPAPEGFEEAILAATKYLETVTDRPSPIILAYQAFAYGQKYQYESQTLKKTDTELRPIRDAAYQAIRQALEQAPKLKDLIRSVWDPPDGSEDRDLECFKGFKEFKDLLGDHAGSTNVHSKPES